MPQIPEIYQRKIETIKKAIILRSGLFSDHGSNIKISVTDFILHNNGVSDLSFTVIIKDPIDCYDCSLEPGEILHIINEYANRLNEASRFSLTEDLTIKQGNSLRGVGIDKFSFNYQEIIDLEFTVYFDPGAPY
jgi:hypothetical protein